MIVRLNKTVEKHAVQLQKYFENNNVTNWSRQVVIEIGTCVQVLIVPDLPNKPPTESLFEFGKRTASRWRIPDIVLVMSETADGQRIAIHGANRVGDLALLELPVLNNDGYLGIDASVLRVANGIMNPEMHGGAVIYSGISAKRNKWMFKI